MNEPTEEAIARATIAIHAIDCEIPGCHELATTGRYAEQGYAAAYALANPDAANIEIRKAARDWRQREVEGVRERERRRERRYT